MSNRVTIQPTKFVNLPGGVETLGCRVYDDYGNSYSNTWEFIPEDPLEVLKKVCTDMTDDQTVAMIDYLVTEEQGCYIGDTWYEHELILDIITGE